MSAAPRRGPSPLLRVVFTLPKALYRAHLGPVVGHRFLMVTYRGRRTRLIRRTVIEVIRYDSRSRESIVLSGYGRAAGWYLSLRSEPALRIQTGRLDYAPCQRFLEPDEARGVAEQFCREHRFEARLVPRTLAMMGAPGIDGSQSPAEAMGSLPMVAFRPPDSGP